MRILTLLTLLLAVSTADAQQQSVKPGINSSYDKADIEQSVRRFEGEGREIFQHREAIVEACNLKPGMAVADVGAGTGLFTRLIAKEVGPEGRVFAVDITEKFIQHIDKTCKEQGIKNVESVICSDKSTKLPPKSVDLIFTSDTYHHFEFPQKTLRSLRRALRPGGQLIVIDFKLKKGADGEWVRSHVRAGKTTVIEEVTAAGFKLLDEPELMNGQYFLRFEKRK